jgi:hypothetical protein
VKTTTDTAMMTKKAMKPLDPGSASQPLAENITPALTVTNATGILLPACIALPPSCPDRGWFALWFSRMTSTNGTLAHLFLEARVLRGCGESQTERS